MEKAICIGCSGYFYKDWRGLFYPQKLPQKEWLPFYARHFNTVEINNTFYRFPEVPMLKKWHNITPNNFKFTLKGSRFITHMKKLSNIDEPLERFYNVAAVMEDKLACILWQLPPMLKRNDLLLENFCRRLSGFVPQVIEFRHNSWFVEPVFNILSRFNIGYCIISAPGDLSESLHLTAPWAYIRFHGKEHWYNYRYSLAEMQEWSDRIATLNIERAFIYFNNDYHANAIFNAQELMDLLDVPKPINRGYPLP